MRGHRALSRPPTAERDRSQRNPIRNTSYQTVVRQVLGRRSCCCSSKPPSVRLANKQRAVLTHTAGLLSQLAALCPPTPVGLKACVPWYGSACHYCIGHRTTLLVHTVSSKVCLRPSSKCISQAGSLFMVGSVLEPPWLKAQQVKLPANSFCGCQQMDQPVHRYVS